MILYTRGESRTMFDTLQTLMKLLADFKVVDRDSAKMCVVLSLVCRDSVDGDSALRGLSLET